jgi:hypothetical protein
VERVASAGFLGESRPDGILANTAAAVCWSACAINSIETAVSGS